MGSVVERQRAVNEAEKEAEDCISDVPVREQEDLQYMYGWQFDELVAYLIVVWPSSK